MKKKENNTSTTGEKLKNRKLLEKHSLSFSFEKRQKKKTKNPPLYISSSFLRNEVNNNEESKKKI